VLAQNRKEKKIEEIKGREKASKGEVKRENGIAIHCVKDFPMIRHDTTRHDTTRHGADEREK
jgi:hypothetical protein